jgi:hypothetical protein
MHVRIVFQYGTGAANNFSASVDNPTAFLRSSARLPATEQVLFQPNDRFAIMPIFIYQRIKDGNPQHGWDQWVSFGARPEVFFTKYLVLALEAGFDHTQRAIGNLAGPDGFPTRRRLSTCPTSRNRRTTTTFPPALRTSGHWFSSDTARRLQSRGVPPTNPHTSGTPAGPAGLRTFCLLRFVALW